MASVGKTNLYIYIYRAAAAKHDSPVAMLTAPSGPLQAETKPCNVSTRSLQGCDVRTV